MSKNNKLSRKQSANQAGGTIINVSRGVPGMPKDFGITVRAVSAWNLNHAGSLQTPGFGCNTPYNPFLTFTTSEQPAYVTWLQQCYANYYTVKSHIKVELINSTVADTVMVALGKDGNISGTHTYNEVAEQYGAVSGAVGHYTGGSNRLILQSSFKPMVDLGVPASNSKNVGDTGSDPSDPYNWILAIQAIAGGTGNIAAKVTVEYDLVFSQLESPSP